MDRSKKKGKIQYSTYPLNSANVDETYRPWLETLMTNAVAQIQDSCATVNDIQTIEKQIKKPAEKA